MTVLRLARLPTNLPAFPHVRQFVPPHLSSAFAIRPQSSLYTLQTSKMSTSPAKKEFLCILPDKPGAQAKRLEVRP
jgi:hypothetical protein